MADRFWRRLPFLAPVTNAWTHRQLIRRFVRREIVGRYRGSIGGLSWSLVQPMAMLVIYTFVFSVVFKARWAAQNEVAGVSFAVVLFVGLIVQGLFAECIGRAPGLIVSHATFVKKVVFPIEILPVVAMGSALFHSFVSFIVLFLAMLLAGNPFHWTILLMPVVLAPFLLLTLGLSWFLAALGVFLRDIGQMIGLLVTALLFLSPVFYPLSAIPESYRAIVLLNPLTFPVEQARDVLIWGKMPSWSGLAVYSAVSWIVAVGGFAWFQRIRKGFADVL
ncbi:lipopolysaccharide transport system permease protein [Bosea sp. BE125]|uniref:ABC transporter permease n=1 Tax=Bosea sp. BE125 TaxID=2817909 RepID=UPI0028678277|nr:ABC transporter permease [Bosea sp. BE125]MDR6874160.1 lipopolysaccharide transport system permease protein [Bosea sp. BE125]